MSDSHLWANIIHITIYSFTYRSNIPGLQYTNKKNVFVHHIAPTCTCWMNRKERYYYIIIIIKYLIGIYCKIKKNQVQHIQIHHFMIVILPGAMRVFMFFLRAKLHILFIVLEKYVSIK